LVCRKQKTETQDLFSEKIEFSSSIEWRI